MSREYCRNFPLCSNTVNVTENAAETPLCASCEREEGHSFASYVAIVAEVEAGHKLYTHLLRSRQRTHEEQH